MIRALMAIVIAPLGVLVGACSGTDAPTTPTPPAPIVDLSVRFTVVGTVVEESSDAGEVRPIAASRVSVWFRRPGAVFHWRQSTLLADADGQFEIPDLPAGTFLTIRADAGSRQQACASNVTVMADAKVGVPLVPTGGRPSRPASPLLSGVVFMNTAQGRQPVSGANIAYVDLCASVHVVHGVTDDNGRYFFCNLPRGDGCLDVSALTDDWEAPIRKQVPVSILGDRILDIDLGR